MDRLLNTKDLMIYFNCSRPSFARMRKTPGFPKPLPGIAGLKWRESDIATWVASLGE